MDERDAEELRMLRARAYGPDADFFLDPSAARRLRELEEASARPATADRAPVGPAADAAVLEGWISPAAEEPVGATGEAGEGPTDAEEGGTEPEPDPDSDPEPAPRARALSRRTVAKGAAVLLAVVAVTAAATTLVVREVQDHPLTVATLPVDPARENLESIGDAVAHQDFFGITALRFAGLPDGEDEVGCLYLAFTEQLDTGSGGYDGVGAGGCEAGPFPAIAQFVVTEDLPETFIERYPLGTALQFVLDDSEVTVRVADGPPGP